MEYLPTFLTYGRVPTIFQGCISGNHISLKLVEARSLKPLKRQLADIILGQLGVRFIYFFFLEKGKFSLNI